MRAMGLKDAAKRSMHEAGVPVVPGYHGEDQTPDRLAAEADAIGFPVLIKARAGGGGKGMRRVDSAADFPAALAAARREAAASFGDEAVLIEKLIAAPRHVEVQVFGDTHGEVVHLFERDCSLQRRHQKVIEEAPAPGMSAAVREAMTDAAVRAAKAIDYVGAGTIEFIADGREGLREDGFWFMEMNTRLQVEHPVTEAVTGLDLVEWQFRVAAGEPLPLAQEAIALRGHAVEARLYAEDAAAGFLPATGRLDRLAFGEDGVRVDTGVVEGDEILPHYDPLLAKLIAHGDARAAAFGRLARCLGGTRVLGTVTNREFLLALCRHPAVLAGALDTSLIERELDALAAPPGPDDRRSARAVAAVLRAAGTDRSDPSAAISSVDRHRSVAARLGPWQLWGEPESRLTFERTVLDGTSRGDGDAPLAPADGPGPDGPGSDRPSPDRPGPAGDGLIAVSVVRTGPTTWTVRDEHGTLPIDLDPAAARRRGGVAVSVDGRRSALCVHTAPLDSGVLELQLGERVHRFGWPLPDGSEAEAADGSLVLSPMPGRIVDVSCAVGEAVEAGQALLTLEAMKMEHALVAPRDGTVERLNVEAGEQVAQGDELLSLGDVSAEG